MNEPNFSLQFKSKQNERVIYMKEFDKTYVLLEDMRSDSYFPGFLVDKVENLIVPVIFALEQGETDLHSLQVKFDEMTLAINALQDEFEENDSEIETVARDSIGVTVDYILKWFGIDMDVEDAIRERDW